MKGIGLCACPKIEWIWHPLYSKDYVCIDCNQHIIYGDEEE